MESSQTMLLKKQDTDKHVAAKKGAYEDVSSTNLYFQMVLFVMEIACTVIHEFIKKKVLQGEELQSFLDQIHIKESLFHFFQPLKCCKCKPVPRGNENHTKMLTHKQFKVLYKDDKSKEKTEHIKRFKGKKIQFCICEYAGKEDIKVDDIDLCISFYVIKAAHPSQTNCIINWLEQIQLIRNELFHLSDLKKMTHSVFNGDWKTLKNCVIGIAKEIKLAYADEVRGKIHDILNKEVSIKTSAIPYERLCREYWESVKSIEFERTQESELKDLEEKAFDMSKLTDDDHDEINKTIHSLQCKVENTTVNVNVKGRQFDETSPNVDNKTSHWFEHDS